MNKSNMNSLKYIGCSLDKPYAPEVFSVISKGENKNRIEPESFTDWCLETFDGAYMPYLSIYGERGRWLPVESFYKEHSDAVKYSSIKEWEAEITNMIYVEYCEENEAMLKELQLPSLEYIENTMKFKYMQIKHCEERILWGSKTDPIVMIKWEWVQRADIEREWSGF